MLLRSLDCADDAAMADVRKDIAAMEAALKKLNEQECKYSAEVESALQQYRELEEQAIKFDAIELLVARLELRTGMDRSTVSRIQTAYDTQYSPFIMAEARRDVSKYWMKMWKKSTLSVSGFAITSKSKLHRARKRLTGIAKHIGSAKHKILPSFFQILKIHFL